MAKGNSLGLTLPAQTAPDGESFDIGSRPLAAWLGALPMANIGETTKLLYQALHDVNRHSHDWKRRLRFLEAIREPLDSMQRTLGQRYAAVSFPLPAKTLQIAALSQRLHLEMAIGYMAAIEEMLSAHFLFHDRHALKVMVHRACRHLSQSLLTAYQIYSQQHPGVWQQLHHLYAFAEARDFHQDSIKDALHSGFPKSSIARIYKQIVLLATASPYRMRQGEAVAVHQALARWSAHAKLLPSHDQEARNALFTLHLDSDEEPGYRSLDHHPCEGTACRLIDTRQLVSMIQEEAGNAAVPPGSLLTPELYTRLIQGWETAPTRSERRNEGGDSIEVVIGMIHIHELLSPTPSSQSPAPQPAQFASTAPSVSAQPATTSSRSGGDPWNPYSGAERKASPIPPSPQQAPARAPLILRWQIINESVGGFRLAVSDGQEAALRVGEVMAVREIHSPELWHLTIVRWIRHFDQGSFEAGVQIIASDVIPAMVKNLTPGKDKGEFQRSLLLPAAPERDQPATLFTPNRLFHPLEKVLLHVSGHRNEIVLGNSIQDSGSFVQFEFHSGEKMDNPSPAQAAGAG